MDSWHDGATFTRFGGTPSICIGPGALATAHTIDESVPVEVLIRCAQALAVAALRLRAGLIAGDQSNTTSWRHTSPARRRSKAAGRSSSGSR